MKWKNRGMKDFTRDKIKEMIKRYRTKTNHHDSNEEDEEGCWSELPYEILDMIIKRIFVIDLINVRAVCKSWRYYSYDKFQPLKQIPWRLVFYDSPTENSSCKLIDPTNKKTYIVNDTKIAEKKLYNMEVHDSKCGWVLMSSLSCQTSGTFFLLYTPFLAENNIIELPVLNSKFLLATFSSAPSLGTTQDDCVFLALDNSTSGDCIFISTCRRGDHTWRTQHFECFFPLSGYRSTGVMSAVYSQGVFYCPSYTGSIGSFNIDRDEWVVLETENKSLVSECLKLRPGYYIHLVKSDEDGGFLLVVRWNSEKEWHVPLFKVLRLDRSKLVWEKLACLGDRAMFIAAKGSSFVMELPKWEGRAFLCSTKGVSLFRVHLKPFYGCNLCYHSTKLYGSHGGKQNWIEPSL